MNSDFLSAFLLGGVNSGSGKTTLAAALLRALRRRGIDVAPFKCGPDYIDPSFHRQAAGRASFNLDPCFHAGAALRSAFARSAATADAAVVEGVMGLFDGTCPGTRAGSSAEIAARLGLPVVLVVNARGISGSIAPLVKGFCEWDPEVRIAGVIADFTGSARHGQLLADALRTAGLPPLLGRFDRNEAWRLPERHLGLTTGTLDDALLDRMADAAEESIDLDRLLELARIPRPAAVVSAAAQATSGLRLGVAQDEAFHFYYEENFELLRERGVGLSSSPRSTTGISRRSSTVSGSAAATRNSSRKLWRQMTRCSTPSGVSPPPAGWCGGECGGFLYLLDGLTGFDGVRYPMLGLLPGEGKMHSRLSALGYREAVTAADGLFGPAGTRIQGHEFHYSSAELPAGTQPFFHARTLHGETSEAGSVHNRIAGSYLHLHFASNPAALDHFVKELAR
ncbi:MAG: cobyrinate a,c-diamide synthase [Lentisphaeria bacterium]|nr:MAG: cobyrinate a,c-diamide synthase [Lentisphaeria bacterium]